MNETKPQDPAIPSTEWEDGGLTKREYFAAKAMQGLLANSEYNAMLIAENSVKAADALIAELNKQPNQ